MSGHGYERVFFVYRTRALKLYMEHLENKPDTATVGEILDEVRPLLEVEGFFNTDCTLCIVDTLTHEILPDEYSVKELRQLPPHQYRLRLFFKTYMDITPLKL